MGNDFAGRIKKASSCSKREATLEEGAASAGGALDVLGFGPFVAAHHFEVHLFTFVQGFETGSHDRGVMNKHILTGILSDESESLLIIEPFDFTAGHSFLLRCLSLWVLQSKKDTCCKSSKCPKVHFVSPIYDSNLISILKRIPPTSRISFIIHSHYARRIRAARSKAQMFPQGRWLQPKIYEKRSELAEARRHFIKPHFI